MTKRKDFGTLLLWGIATNGFCIGQGLFRSKREAQARCNAFNGAYSLHIYQPVRVTLSWERPARKRGGRDD